MQNIGKTCVLFVNMCIIANNMVLLKNKVLLKINIFMSIIAQTKHAFLTMITNISNYCSDNHLLTFFGMNLEMTHCQRIDSMIQRLPSKSSKIHIGYNNFHKQHVHLSCDD